MAFFKKKSSKSKKKAKIKEPKDFTLFNKLLGAFFFSFSSFLTLASISYLFSWRADQSLLNTGISEFLFDFKNLVSQNIMGKMGAFLAHTFIYNGFGIGAFLLYPIFLIIGFNLYFNNKFHIRPKTASKLLVTGLWVSLVCSLLFSNSFPLLGGLLGYGVYIFSKSLIGVIGIVILLGLITVFFLYVAFGIDILEWVRNKRLKSDAIVTDDELTEESIFDKDQINVEKSEPELEPITLETDTSAIEESLITPVEEPQLKDKPENEEENLELEIEEKAKEEKLDKTKQKEHYGIDEPFDPRLDLRDYIFPEIDFLNKYDKGPKTEVSKEDLEKSKNMIVQTLNNYKIRIAQIKATIGPTVTLFEIVPEAGVRISKIKNLEDDIALSLAALGIRIIAPIPGKGTIGIEVPNKKPEIVSMHSVISSAKYQNSDAALPVCLGKTISNEVYVADLAKMPHLLMAGATGQGKSVGLNAIIVSLLYRKHPAELKFVMVDPKKVELTLYQTIERHYLAKLPGEGEAIITDNKQVITTLNSLCEEMDQRYALLQAALVRNIKEYNTKFIIS